MKSITKFTKNLPGILATAGLLLTASCFGKGAQDVVTVTDRPDCKQTNIHYIGNSLPLKPMSFIKIPVGSIQPKEEITLIPMGAARLRISAFPNTHE